MSGRALHKLSLAAQDDLLGYLVRNEAGTNDGTIVPFEPPDTLPGRRTRFLPAVVAITSSHGAVPDRAVPRVALIGLSASEPRLLRDVPDG